jgi:SnoaL-like domain
MKTTLTWLIAPLLAFAMTGESLHAASPTAATRLAWLEDRESIRLLLRDYGRLLDERRFDDFGQLFAADGEYVSAGTTTRGPTAIADSLWRIMTGNPLGLSEPNFHVLFNERIELQGDQAQATSQSFFVAPGTDGAPRLIMMASYDDTFVRTPKGWRYARRVVHGNMVLRSPQASPALPPDPSVQ